MITPGEELVNVWLQEFKGFFTMTNVKCPKKEGGMGAEIDILAMNSNGKKIWVEVSVCISPRCNYKKEERLSGFAEEMYQKFDKPAKVRKAKEILGKKYERWFVYGQLPLSNAECEEFPKELKKRGIKKAIRFGDILKDLSKLKGSRLDSARGYVNLFECFYPLIKE